MIGENPYDIGLGTYSLTGEAGVEALTAAIEMGYRHIDTARLYGNEREVGDAIDRADVDREELFVATKIDHFTEQEPTPEYIRQGVAESKEKLGVETVDLLYHHWRRHPEHIDTVLPVFEELLEAGDVARIGASNYTVEDVERASDRYSTPIYANQVEMHPLLQQEKMRATLRDHGCYLVAYSPLAQGAVFEVPVLQEIAEKHDTTPAAVSLAWLRGTDGVVPIPRSADEAHLRANFEARHLSLDPEDVERIDAIEETRRLEDPEWMAW